MRWAGVLWVVPLLGGLVESSPPAPPGPSSFGPTAFSASHYALLKEYSPFVKSLETAKVTGKSPDLVAVGYGRVKGEDYVIIQQKDESGKRERIGSRFGSQEFPYRLKSVQNAANRKTFMALLEGRDGRTKEIGYADETKPLKTETGASTNASSGQKNTLPGSSSAGGTSKPPGGGPLGGLGKQNLESMQNEITAIEQNLQDPAWSGNKENASKRLEALKNQINSLKNPEELGVFEIKPSDGSQ